MQRKISNRLHEQERNFENTATDTNFLNGLASGKYDIDFVEKYTGKSYYLFVYPAGNPSPGNILFWNTQVVQPDVLLSRKDSLQGFEKLVNGGENKSNGYYAWRKIITGNYLIVGLIPVKWDYFVTNIYLKNDFAADEDIDEGYDIVHDTDSIPAGNITPVYALDNTKLFSIYKKSATGTRHDNLIAAWLRIISAVLVLLFIHLLAITLSQQKGAAFACIFLTLVIVLLRITSYFAPIPLNFKQFELFSSTIYASNNILPSLGDLLINAILFTWLILFARQQLIEKKEYRPPASNFFRWGISITGAFILIITTLVGGSIIQTMVIDSKIPFDILEFSALNTYTVIGFFSLCCIAMTFFFLTQVVLFFLNPLFREKPALLFLVVTICSLVTLSTRLSRKEGNFELFLIVWLMVFLFLLTRKPLAFFTAKLVSSKLIFWLFFFSLSITTVLIIKIRAKERGERNHYAETLSNKKDRNNESIVSGMLSDFRGTYLADNFERFRNDSTSRVIKDSLHQANLISYTSRFTTRIYLFDKDRNRLSAKDTTSFETLNAILNTQARETNNTPDLYFFDEEYDRYTYISYKQVKDTANRLMGHAFILASSIRNKSATAAPEFFTKGYDKSIENSALYAFAVYDNFQLITRHNDYNFPTRLSEANIPPINENAASRPGQNGYDEIWYNPSPGKVVIIARQSKLFIESITLFSYLFCSFLLLTGILWLLNSFIRTRFSREKLAAYWQLTIRNQVYGTVIFISVLSFIVIGVATILFFVNRYENNNREKLSKAVQLMEREMRDGLEKLTFSDDAIKAYDSINLPRLDSMIERVARIHNTDVNLYDTLGNLQTSSIKIPYNLGIVSRKINPVPYFRLHALKSSQYFEKEKIGTLEYLSNYIPVVDEKGHEYAYLNVSYFLSEQGFDQEISNFIVTIINLNAFIFLIAGIVALIIANRITRSFSFISDRMSDVNLGKVNEAIVWNRNDEIGQLVAEYNKMVNKLEDSAAALAKSEREDAWREMARQVAHEIKNPLTPMKLSLQYLQRAITGDAPNVKELSSNVAQTLVEQIDHLSQIAGEFGQFANIGSPKKEIFDSNESIRVVTQLHATGDNLHLEWKGWPQPLLIFADRTQINRLFTNLLQNAIQAVPKERKPHIVVESSLISNRVLVMVSDNGDGIPEEMRSSIFTPNFTTKTSGTGLGLAMCKGIVEQVRGQIWFETKTGEGTTFYVEIPLATS